MEYIDLFIKQKDKIQQYLFYTILFVIISIGIYLRIKAFIAHSYYLVADECHSLTNLKINFLSYIFTYDEGANFIQGYKLILKTIYSIWGMNWVYFKVPSIIAGILSLFAFTSLTLKVYKNKLLSIIAVIFFSISNNAIFYSSQLKPYEIDILFTIVIINSFLNIKEIGIEKFLNSKKLYYYIPIALFMIYTSTPSIAVMSICLCTLFIEELMKKNKLVIKKLFFIDCTIFAFIFFEYFTYIRNFSNAIDVKSQWLSESFFFAPKSFEAVNSIFSYIFFEFFWFDIDTHIHYNNIVLIAFIIIIISGTIKFLSEKDIFKGIIVFSPIYFFLAISYLYIYPFCNRPISFLIPIFIIVLLKTFDFNQNKLNKIISSVLAIFVCYLYLTEVKNIDSISGLISYNKNFHKEIEENLIPLFNLNNQEVMISILPFSEVFDNENIIFTAKESAIKDNIVSEDFNNLYANYKKVYFLYDKSDITPEEIDIIKNHIENNNYVQTKYYNGNTFFTYMIFQKN